MVIRLALAVAALLALASGASAEEPQAPVGAAAPRERPATAEEMEATLAVERPVEETAVQEMVVLSLRVVLRRPAAALEVAVPPIPDVRSTTLVNARWSANVDGLGAKGFERRIALFPQRSGMLDIPAFQVRATLTGDGGGWTAIVARTEPVSLAVAPGPADGMVRWWLPARSVTVSDAWDPAPDRLRPGEAAQRTVVLEAAGVQAEQLPPLPPLRTAGVVTFANPVTLETLARPDGPLARATYRWDVRLGVPEPVVLQALTVPWFDTVAREAREAVVPARRIGATPGGPSAPTPGATEPVYWAAAGLLGFAFALAGISRWSAIPPRSWRLDLLVADVSAAAALRRAARAGNATAFRAAVGDLARRDREKHGAAPWLADEPVRAGLAGLDRHLFARAAEMPPLRPLADAVLSARRRGRPSSETVSALAPLDGAPLPREIGPWQARLSLRRSPPHA